MNEMFETQPCDAIRLIDALMRAGKTIESRLDDALAPVGLTTSQWSLLRALAEVDEALPLGEIAARLACVKSNATQLADRLEALGYIVRVPNPADRRSTQAVMTDAGREAYRAGADLVHAFEREHLQALSPGERTALDAYLARILN